MPEYCSVTDCLSAVHASDLSRIEKLRLEVEIRRAQHALSRPNPADHDEDGSNERLLAALCAKVMELHGSSNAEEKAGCQLLRTEP